MPSVATQVGVTMPVQDVGDSNAGRAMAAGLFAPAAPF